MSRLLSGFTRTRCTPLSLAAVRPSERFLGQVCPRPLPDDPEPAVTALRTCAETTGDLAAITLLATFALLYAAFGIVALLKILGIYTGHV